MTTAYAARGEQHALRRDAELRRSAVISRLRLAVFLAAAGLLLWTLTRGATPPMLGLSAVMFVVFGGLVAWHARVEERAAWHEALRTATVHAIARVERRWDVLPAAEAPASVDVAHHPYAMDLDLFGRASLFQWLGPAATPLGSERLASWLLAPSPPEEIGVRQGAVQELAGRDVWREELAAHGVLARDARLRDVDAFLRWAEGPGIMAGRGPLLQAIVIALTASIWLLIALQAMAVVPPGLWLIPVALGIVLSLAMAKRIYAEFEHAGAGQQSLTRYASLFEHATAAPFAGAALGAVQERLSAAGQDAPACMRRLNRLLGFAELRTAATLFHIPIQSFTLWDFHIMFALDRWRRDAGARVRGWMEAIAELDALSSLAAVRHDNPEWCFPRIDQQRVFAAAALGHPLIAADRRVANDVEVGPPGTLLLVTGSNMSGKSTLLRAIGLNAVLAQAGGAVCARSLSLPACDLQSSIRVTDSLELGLSYFMAALARLKGVVDAAERPRDGRVLLYLLDEILQGTNSAERGIAVRAVARHLLDAGAIGAMTTHDLNLAGEEPLQSAARLVHFTEIVDESGTMRFDYRLREGIATSRNALRLMKMIGIDL